MKSIYVPYQAETEPGTRFQVLSATDRHGSIVAVVSEASIEVAERELTELLLHLLGAEAANGRNRFADFPDSPPEGPYVALPVT